MSCQGAKLLCGTRDERVVTSICVDRAHRIICSPHRQLSSASHRKSGGYASLFSVGNGRCSCRRPARSKVGRDRKACFHAEPQGSLEAEDKPLELRRRSHGRSGFFRCRGPEALGWVQGSPSAARDQAPDPWNRGDDGKLTLHCNVILPSLGRTCQCVACASSQCVPSPVLRLFPAFTPNACAHCSILPVLLLTIELLSSISSCRARRRTAPRTSPCRRASVGAATARLLVRIVTCQSFPVCRT